MREEAARREAAASEAGARHVQKLESIGVLAGGIAHDFNNLLHVVLGNADLARLQLDAAAPAREYLDEVIRATQRAGELTQQLLAYSGRGAIEIRHLNLSDEVREMATLLRTAISKQATLVWELTPGLPAVTADPTQVRQVVMNLITNASDALGDSAGTITLRTGLDGELVFLEVSDTGIGMDTGTLQRIFDPFFSTKFTGRGLGLAAVMGIVESHHGHVRIRSAPGEGTTFRILFPAVPDSADREPGRLTVPQWRGRGTVLVVEDEEGVREVVGRMLERLGFQVITAEDGIEALQRLDHHGGAMAAVLLDLSMPRMGGPEVLQQIRERRPEAPIILMSGYTEQEVASKLLGPEGAVAFLQKPFLPEDLTSVLRDVSLSVGT
jgi:two-component system, cell cycle sensor histidine kinase and response regulator CckA